jgi:hypothetical protein
VAYGADDGVYVSDLTEPHMYPVKVLSLPEVMEMDALGDEKVFILRSGAYPCVLSVKETCR